jgi:hypothetical protein
LTDEFCWATSIANVASADDHMHEPLMHGCRLAHAMPQPPQFSGSLDVSTHAPKHVTPVVHVTPQLLPSQVAVSYFATGQASQREPQVLIDVLLTHWPLQSCWPDLQPHTPVVHTLPPVQMVPHVPQLALSLKRSTQRPEQSDRPAFPAACMHSYVQLSGLGT